MAMHTLRALWPNVLPVDRRCAANAELVTVRFTTALLRAWIPFYKAGDMCLGFNSQEISLGII